MWKLIGMAVLFGLITSQALADQSYIVLYDIEQAIGYDITGFLQSHCGITDIQTVTAVNTLSGDGDEWLIIAGESEMIILDALTFNPLLKIDNWKFRNLFGLPDGSGMLSVLASPGRSVDELLYRDSQTGQYYSADFSDYSIEPFTGMQLPDGFVTGFSWASIEDIGLLNRISDGSWQYVSFPDETTIPMDLTALFGSQPMSLTEYEIATGAETVRFLVAVVAGEPPTPTPTSNPGSPTPTPVDGNVTAVIANGLGEDIWAIDGRDYSVNPHVAWTGQAPNQIVVHDDRFYIVNSLSNSIGVYAIESLQRIQEISVGTGRNPFSMAFLDANQCYVSNFLTNTLSLIRVDSGEVIDELELPGSDELPHDPGTATWARPTDMVIVGDTCYVACANLDDTFVAGGSGIICRINCPTHQMRDWITVPGRNTVGIEWDSRYPDWLWIASAGDYAVGQGFIGNGNICIVSIPSGELIDCIEMADAPLEMVFGADRLYTASAMDGSVGRIDLASLTRMTPLAMPGSGQGLNFISGLAIDPAGKLWVLEFNQDMLYLIDTRNGDDRIRNIEMGDGPDAIGFILRRSI